MTIIVHYYLPDKFFISSSFVIEILKPREHLSDDVFDYFVCERHIDCFEQGWKIMPCWHTLVIYAPNLYISYSCDFVESWYTVYPLFIAEVFNSVIIFGLFCNLLHLSEKNISVWNLILHIDQFHYTLYLGHLWWRINAYSSNILVNRLIGQAGYR